MPADLTPAAAAGRVLRRQDVLALTSLSRSNLYERIRRGEFPKPLVLGPRRVAWRADEVEAWLAGLRHGLAPAPRPGGAGRKAARKGGPQTGALKPDDPARQRRR